MFQLIWNDDTFHNNKPSNYPIEYLRCWGLKRKGRGTYESDKVPILGLVERAGDIHFSVVKNVQTATVKPIMEQVIASDTIVYTDEYCIYNFLDESDEYTRKVVCHSKGEYALDLNGDGKKECHVNTQEGIWSILRPWIRPHRGINKRYLAFYVCLCEFVYRNSELTPTQVLYMSVNNNAFLILL